MNGKPLRRVLPGGVVDASLASLATFGAGIAATRILSPSDLGVYAVFFAVFVMAAVVPQQLLFVPVEIVAVSHPLELRLGMLVRSLRLGAATAVASSVLVGLAVVATAGKAGSELLLPLTVTAALTTILSPIQDHIRRLLHAAQLSWRAAGVSAVQLGAVLAALPVLNAVASAAWVPFGALAVANACSLGWALAATWRHRDRRPAELPSARRLVRVGRWLLLTSLVPTAGGFVAAVIISELAGSDVLGLAEAARIAAQPLFVLGVGLSVVLGPRSMEAAMNQDRRSARRQARALQLPLVAASIVFLAWASVDWVGNPLSQLIPAAYQVAGLVAVSGLANMLFGMVNPYRNELAGAGRERQLAIVDMLTTGGLVVGAATAAATAEFARALGIILTSLGRMVGYRPALAAVYRSPADDRPSPSSAAGRPRP